MFFLIDRRLQVVLDGKSSRECPVNAGVLKGLFLAYTFPALLYINDLPDDVVCNIYSTCNQAFDLWQQLELSSELESDIRDTVDWGRKWLVVFSATKTEPVSFKQSINTGAIDVKKKGSVIFYAVAVDVLF